MSNFITNAELRIEAERLCDENEKLREENEMLRNYQAEHERDMAGCYEKNPDGLPVGLTISPDGTLLDWEGKNYVLQSIVRDVEREPNGNMAGDEKCHVTQYNTEDDSMLCYGCGACGYGWHVSKNDKPFTYCPNCGREVVYPIIIMDEWDKDGHLVQSDFVNLNKLRGNGNAVLDASMIRRREVVRKLKEYREHPPVQDIDGFIVENTYSVGEVEGIVTGKELFTTGEFIDSLISLIDERKELNTENYTDLMVNMDKNAETLDTEDTRESLEEDVHVWCALYPAWTYAGKFRNKVFDWLDRQEAITKRSCRVEYEDMRDCLLAVVDGLEDDTKGWHKKCAYLQEEVNKLQSETEHLNKALEAYRSLNALLHSENMELRRTVDTLSQAVGDGLTTENEKLKKLVALQQEFSNTICGSKCKRKDEYCGFTANEECHYEREIYNCMQELGIEVASA